MKFDTISEILTNRGESVGEWTSLYDSFASVGLTTDNNLYVRKHGTQYFFSEKFNGVFVRQISDVIQTDTKPDETYCDLYVADGLTYTGKVPKNGVALTLDDGVTYVVQQYISCDFIAGLYTTA